MKYEKVIEKLKKRHPIDGDWTANGGEDKGIRFKTSHPDLFIDAATHKDHVTINTVVQGSQLLCVPRHYSAEIKSIKDELVKHNACDISYPHKTVNQTIRQRINKMSEILGAP